MRGDHDSKEAPGEGHPNSGLRILVIEDNEDDFLLTRNALRRAKRCHFEIEGSPGLAEGMERLRGGGIDVVLLDLALPDCRGIESFERLNEAFRELPVVVLSGNEDEEIALQTVRMGAQDYLMKGQLDPDNLGRVVSYAYERKQALVRVTALTGELTRRNLLLREELELAHEIQRALLSGTVARTGGGGDDDHVEPWQLSQRYLPTDTLAGDFFRVYPLSGGRVGILICDVMGHGVRSALIAALLSGLIEEFEGERECTARMLTRLNAGLQRVLERCQGVAMFATACYIIADPLNGKLEFSSAGHPMPFLARASDGKVVRLEKARGPALGFFENARFIARTTPIENGDFLLLFTDGLSEVETPDGEYFESRIADVLARRRGSDGESMLDGLIEEARQLCPDGCFADDVCLVGLRIAQVLTETLQPETELAEVGA
ncbi:MAG: SpoIIE family protein phosphatase [Luteolibacter sp.]